jgi:basic membrane protein A
MSKERRLIKRASAFSALALLAMPLLAACGATATPVPATATTGNTVEATATTGTVAATATTMEEATPTTAVAEETATTGTGTGASLKVGLVTDVGRLNDKSFNQSSWEGVLQAQQELGIEAKAIETVDTSAYEQNIGQFISEGYDVVVTVGFALGEATVKAATDNPDIKFIGVDQFQAEELPNLAGLIFDEDKAGYLAGVLAASISASNNIGAVCGTDDVPPVWKFGEGYKAGALSVKPDITVQVTYHSDVDITKTFTDPEWGKTTGLSMIDRGADVLFGAGGITGNGAIFAAKERSKLAIGVDTDQYFTIGDEDALVSSAMKLLTPGVYNQIKAIQDDTFKGGNTIGEVGLAPFHDNEDKVPADVKANLEQISKGLMDGTIKTCVSPAKGAPAPEGCSGTGDAMTTPTP